MIETFDRALHGERVDGWYRARGMEPPAAEMLSAVGVVNECAAGWLYLTGTAVALVDGVIAAPGAPSEAIDEVIEALTAVARASGARVLLGYTQRTGVLACAARLGWERDGKPYHLVTKGLR